MINFLKTCFFTFTIWLLSSFLNALLYGIVFNLGNIVRGDFNESTGLAFFFSLLFSAPGIFILWIVFLVNSANEQLSKVLLKAAFILSLFSCVFISFLPEEVYMGHWFLLSSLVVISSVSAVLFHHSFLKSFYHRQPHSNV